MSIPPLLPTASSDITSPDCGESEWMCMRLLEGLVSLVLLLAAAAAPSASAHHSPVMFDQSKTLMLSGTVRQFQWTNPHCYIQLVVEEGGERAEWNMEMGAPVYLYNRGWRPSTLKAGDRIRITAAPLRSGANGGLVLGVVSLDGKTIGRVS
jgi:hypothetical protein